MARALGEAGQEYNAIYNEAVKHEVVVSGCGTSELVRAQQAKIDAQTIDPSMVASLHAITFNSAGVLQPVADSSNALSQFVTQAHFGFEEAPIQQYLHARQNKADMVPFTVDATILTGLPDNGAQVELVYSDKVHGKPLLSLFMFKPHRTKVRNPDGLLLKPQKTIEHYTSDKHKGIAKLK